MKLRARLPALLVASLLLLSCDRGEPAPGKPTPQAPRSASAAAPAPSAAPAPAVKADEWYVGSWSGSYEAQHYLVETNKGEGLKQWADDEGKENAGPGKLALQVDANGRITGTASGPLGELIASGQVDEDAFRVQLGPREPSAEGFRGYFVAKREGKAVKGQLQASSGDSLKVRDAPVSLERK
jgi:hypothetical protein